MPIEGLTSTDSTAGQGGSQSGQQAGQGQQAGTSDATAQNTAAGTQSGAGTQTAQNNSTEAPKEKTFTQADVDRIVANRLKSGVKAELKKIFGDSENGDVPTLEGLQRQLREEQAKRQSLEARQTVREYLTDARNQLNIRPENLAAIEEMVQSRIQLGDNGIPSNLKDAVNAVKNLAPALFSNMPVHIDAGAGRIPAPNGTNMNDFIRQMAGRK